MKSDKKILEFIDVYKSYVKKELFSSIIKKVLNGVSFEIFEGEIVGLIGMNGAGKTTIIKIICGITQPDSGIVRVFSRDVLFDLNYKLRIGYTSEIPYFCQAFTVKDTVDFFYSISQTRVKDLQYIYKLSGIEGFLDEKVKNLSKGMLQKLAIASSLVNDPELLILDEPTSGLDPLYIKNMRDILLKLNNDGKTIFFSSHTISEVEKICHRVIIINKGRIVKTLQRNEFQDKLEDIFINYVENDN